MKHKTVLLVFHWQNYSQTLWLFLAPVLSLTFVSGQLIFLFPWSSLVLEASRLPYPEGGRERGREGENYHARVRTNAHHPLIGGSTVLKFVVGSTVHKFNREEGKGN